MKTTTNLVKIGAWSFGIICGIGHLSFELFAPKPESNLKIMENISVSLPGKLTDMATITYGISLVMGLMLIVYGLLNLGILKHLNQNIKLIKQLVYFNLTVSILAFALSIQYLFIFPTALSGIALASNAIAAIRLFKHA